MGSSASQEPTHLKTRGFRGPVFRVVALGSAGVVLVEAILALSIFGMDFLTIMGFIMLVPCVATYVLSKRGYDNIAGYVLMIGICGMLMFRVVFAPDTLPFILGALCLCLTLACFLISMRLCLALASVLVVYVVVLNVAYELSHPVGVAYNVVIEVLVIVLFTASLWILSRQINRMQKALADKMERIQEYVPSVSRSAARVADAAKQLHATAGEQREGALRQTAAAAETRKAVHTARDLSRDIAEASQVAQAATEAAQENNEAIEKSLKSFAEQASRIGQILESIRTIANRTDILALNAALEGVRAGEAGRGFSLVAERMQSLTEQVTAAVNDVEDITRTITSASEETEENLQRGAELVVEAARSGRDISRATTQQLATAEQMAMAMDDIVTISRQVEQGSEGFVSSAEELSQVSEDLPAEVRTLAET